MASFYVYGKDMLFKKQEEPPYMLILTASYIAVFSFIEHKEPRFLLPIVPFCFLMLGYFIAKLIKTQSRYRRLIRYYCMLAIFVEIGMFIFYLNMHFRNWEPMAHLAAKDVAPHSVFTLQALDTPYYSWTHRSKYFDIDGKEFNRTKIYTSGNNPSFFRKKKGAPLPTLHEHDFNYCFQLIDDI